MRTCVALLSAMAWFLFPAASRADVTYTLSVNYPGNLITGVPGGGLDVSFSEPSILTTTTSGVAPLFNVSVGGSITGCVPSNAELDNPGTSSGDIIINFMAPCGPDNNFDGAAAFFDVPLLELGVFDAIGHQNMKPIGDIGTLTISSPEPPVAILIEAGLLALVFGSLRRKTNARVKQLIP
jgi:hypothetical protein